MTAARVFSSKVMTEEVTGPSAIGLAPTTRAQSLVGFESPPSTAKNRPEGWTFGVGVLSRGSVDLLTPAFGSTPSAGASRANVRTHQTVVPPALRQTLEGPPQWTQQLYALVSDGRSRSAMLLLFRNVDELLRQGQFKECDLVVSRIALERLDTNLLVGLMAATLPARTRLPNRAQVLSNVERRLRVLAPDRCERLLANLR